MNRRVLAAVAAVLLAAAGAWVILGYVQGADARAQSAEALTDVLVVTAEVPAGTPAGDLAGSVATEQVPARLVDDQMLTDLSEVGGLVTTAELLPGELLQAGRFGDPAALRADGSLPAPEGTVEVSVTLERQRAAGGTVAAGDLVGVLGSFDVPDGGGTRAVAIDGVTVTRVALPADPDGVYTITLALPRDAASSTVAAQSEGRLWLSLQASGTAYAASLTDGSTVGALAAGAAGDTASTSDTPTTGSASTSGDDS